MSRYRVHRPRGWVEYTPDLPEITPTTQPTLTVKSQEPYDTGLVDERGHPIWKHPEPIGFPITSAS